MRPLTVFLVALAVAVLPAGAQSYYEVCDVPTDIGANTYVPWVVVRNDSGVHSAVLGLPPNTPINALHRRGTGEWLMSVESGTMLGGTLFEPRDVFSYDGSVYTMVLDGSTVGFPPETDFDAILIDPVTGDLVLSVATPLVLALPLQPADLFRYTGVVSFYFDATAAGIPDQVNLTGAHMGNRLYFTLDLPTTIGANTYLPGQVLSWDGSTLAIADPQPAWPANRSSRIDALAFLPNPGAVPPVISVDLVSATQIRINFPASSCAGGERYGIYEGTLGSFYSHGAMTGHCAEMPPSAVVAFQAADSYYLVVPNNPNHEGSYGLTSAGAQRPTGGPVCAAPQALGCP